MDRAGFDAIEVPLGGNFVKKLVRDLKEDPWERSLAWLPRRCPTRSRAASAAPSFFRSNWQRPESMIELYYSRLVEIGVLNRVQITCNTFDQIKRALPWMIPMFRNLGLQIVLALSYTISPRHTDEYYAQKTRELLPFKPDAIYLKDQGGLLTVDRARTLLPVILQNANGMPVELHSHCTTGLAPLVYLEALQLGGPHAAHGRASVGRRLVAAVGVQCRQKRPAHGTIRPYIDENLLRVGLGAAHRDREAGQAADRRAARIRLRAIHPSGPRRGDLEPQAPACRTAHSDRLDEVLEESVQVRKDLGYPIMITPLSQFVVTQAAINVATGERYKLIIDELILFAQGVFGDDSGYAWMDQNLKDRLLSMPRAAELAARKNVDMSLKEIYAKLGGPGVSDEELLLRYIMKGDQEIAAMRAAGPPKQYFNSGIPLLTLLEEIGKHKGIRYVHVQRGGDALLVQNRH